MLAVARNNGQALAICQWALLGASAEELEVAARRLTPPVVTSSTSNALPATGAKGTQNGTGR